jgi:hypothetical protein
MTATEKFDAWITSRVGKRQWSEIEQEGAKENSARRSELVAQKREREADRDQALADIKPKLLAATARLDKAKTELQAANNAWCFLRRRQSSVNDVAARDIAKLDRELRETADPSIFEFIEQTHAMERTLHFQAVRDETRPTGRDGTWGQIAKMFSNRPTIEQRVGAIRAAREAAERLTAEAVGDVQAALAEIRAGLPDGDLELQPTGQEIEIPAL